MHEVEQAVDEGREAGIILPLDAGLCGWPKCSLDKNSAERFCHGNPVIGAGNEGMHRVFSSDGTLLGLADLKSDGLLHPTKVFVMEIKVD